MNRQRSAWILAAAAVLPAACGRTDPAPATAVAALEAGRSNLLAGPGLTTDAGGPVDLPAERVQHLGGAGLRPAPGASGIRP